MIFDYDQIALANEHWRTGSFHFQSYPVERKILSELKRHLASRHIITLQGLRRTGKSVLQEQLVQTLVATHPNLPVSHLFRFSFENDNTLRRIPASELRELLTFYLREIVRTPPRTLSQPVIIALDEVQNIENWQSVMKSFYDLSPFIKCIVTGSSSLYLHTTTESLAGRSIDFTIPPLDFAEFLVFLRREHSLPFCDSLDGLRDSSPTTLSLEEERLFHDFLLLGGFPDAAIMYREGRPIPEIQRYIRESVVAKIVEFDLRKYFNLHHEYADRRLFEVCCKESGCFLEISKLAPEVKISQMSIKKHLDIFRQVGLITFLTKYDKKLRREISSTRKVYTSSPSLIYSMLGIPHVDDGTVLGHAAETYAFQKLSEYGVSIFVERGREAGSEIDFYLPNNGLLIECKYTTRARSNELDYLATRAGQLNAAPVVLTRKPFPHEALRMRPVALL